MQLSGDAKCSANSVFHLCQHVGLVCHKPTARIRIGEGRRLFKVSLVLEWKWLLVDDHSCPTTQRHTFGIHPSRLQPSSDKSPEWVSATPLIQKFRLFPQKDCDAVLSEFMDAGPCCIDPLSSPGFSGCGFWPHRADFRSPMRRFLGTDPLTNHGSTVSQFPQVHCQRFASILCYPCEPRSCKQPLVISK